MIIFNEIWKYKFGYNSNKLITKLKNEITIINSNHI